jgi:hypothetical protein
MSLLWLILGGLRKALSAVWGFVANHPWQAACIALLAASLWLYGGKQDALAERDAARLTIKTERAAYAKAQDDARKLALAEKARLEQISKDKAHAADQANTQAQADARALADSYIARMRVKAGGSTCPALAAAEDHGAGVPESLPTGSVMVDDADVRSCSGAVAYALKAHEWVLGIGAE